MNTKDIGVAIEALNPSGEEAEVVINDLVNLIDLIEDKLSELGVEHQIDVYLGEYGSGGRSLVLEDSDDGWDSYSAGDWMASSATC